MKIQGSGGNFKHHHNLKNQEQYWDTFKFINIPEKDRMQAKGSEKIVLDNIALVAHFVKRFVTISYVSKDDLLQAGLEGLVRASRGFDPDYGVKFSTYASMAILRSIGSTIYGAQFPVSLTSKTAKKINELNHIVKDVLMKTGKEPTINELADKLDLDFEMTFILRDMTKNVTIDFQDESVDSMIHTMPIESEYDNAYSINSYIEDIYDQLEVLPRLEGAVILLRSGLYNAHGYDVQTVGYILDIMPGMVRDIEFQAIDHLRDASAMDLLGKNEKADSLWEFIGAKIYEKQSRDLTSKHRRGKL